MTSPAPEPVQDAQQAHPGEEQARNEPYLLVRNNRLNVRSAAAQYRNWGGNYFIDWGDGSARTWASGQGGWYMHTYQQPGTYMIAIVPEGFNDPQANGQVWIRDGLTPAFTVAEVADDPGLVELVFTDTPLEMIGDLKITWEKGGTPQVVTARTGAKFQHRYGKSGTYDVHVYDQFTTRGADKKVTVTAPAPDPALSVVKGDTDMTAKLTVTPGDKSKKLKIDWDDYTAFEEVAAGGGTKDHVFAEEYRDKTVYVTVAYEDGSKLNIAEVTLPLAA